MNESYRHNDEQKKSDTDYILHDSVYINVNEKLISQSKKELESFIQAKFEDYNLERASQKALRALLPVRNQGTVIKVF